MHIPLHKPFWGKKAEAAVIGAMRTGSGTADGPHSGRLRKKLQEITGAKFALPVTSCTHAMDLAVACLGAKTGDEIIVPSFTLASTATAAMIRGATPVFADIDPITYCLDPKDVERVITKKTVGIITVHYAGMAGPNFDALLALAKKYKLWVVEDAAHCIGSYFSARGDKNFLDPLLAPYGAPITSRRNSIVKGSSASEFGKPDLAKILSPQAFLGRHLGTFGTAGAFSFHGTKNVACGEGGAVVTNNQKLADAMEIFRAIGTDRQAFLQGKVSIYQWVGEGSSYFLSDIFAALVNVQLDTLGKINHDRQHIAETYTRSLTSLRLPIQLPIVPIGMTVPNWHIYGIKFATAKLRDSFIRKMREKHIEVSSHYVPLHSAPMGKKITKRFRKLPVTDNVASTIVRMPIYAGMSQKELEYVITTAKKILQNL